ncbi:copine-3 isoform X2 [Nematostella vectensis]|uniref:copine-3 isoform X2 n=1 Tax=Nematostella vectensis TaxID=45351 RepID=UPI00207732AB|nr:copine-3 isoform X2 [Nematostella vectensis]
MQAYRNCPYPTSGPGAPPATAQCLSRVQLNISCKNLIDKDVMSKSDPLVVVMMLRHNNWEEVGRTERLENTLNPNFSTTIVVDYFFEELQKLKFMVYDIDSASGSLKNADFLGEMQCTLGQLVSSATYTHNLKIPSGKPAGNMTVTTEEVAGTNDEVQMVFRAQKLDNKDFFGKSDPYLEFSRAKEDGSFVVVHRTEVVSNNLNPKWKPIHISSQQLCNGDYDRVLKVNCYDWDDDGSHDLIGTFTTTLRELSTCQQGGAELQWPCINEKKRKKKKNYKNSGVIFLSSCQVVRVASFLDFIQGGCQINFTVGIDFTGSNGNPASPTSLHYINPYAPNEYCQALTAVGEIIQDYDSDKLFPAFGFGAKVPPNNMVSHQFALNFNHTNPFCAGLQGLIEAYQQCVRQVTLYGPTNIAPIISNVAMYAQAAAQQPYASNYYILLILTDGVISDMDQTKRAIVQASGLPMSIIIVGVGSADFEMMEELDADDGLLRSEGSTAQRDIVQFVPFRKFKNLSSAALAKEVLAEVPGQVTGYYKMRNISPGGQPTAPPRC